MVISDEIKREIYEVATMFKAAQNYAADTFFEIEGEIGDDLSEELIKAWEEHIESGNNNPEIFIDMLRNIRKMLNETTSCICDR